MTDGRLVRGERTRTAILDAAVQLATEVGLASLSLSQLAERLSVSKSGLFAHWRSKVELQMATIDRAREQWIAEVVSPALRAPRGVRRLWALHEQQIRFYESGTLPGDCFFTNTKFEYALREGPVHDRLAEVVTEWLALAERLATEAVEAGELTRSADPAQLAFEIDAIGVGAVHQSRVLDRAAAHRRARTAVLDRLRALCPDPTLLPEDS